MSAMEISIDEVIAGLRTQKRDVSRFEVEILQWAYECFSQMSEGEGFQQIGWTWTNDGTWTSSFIAVPNDVVGIKEVYHNGAQMIERTDDYKKGLKGDEYYIDGPYLQFTPNFVPNVIEAKVLRIKTNEKGRMVIPEHDSLTIRYYILWKFSEIEMRLAKTREAYYLAKDKASGDYRQYLKERRKARGEFNRQTDQQHELAQLEWMNTFREIRPTWQ